MTELLYSLRKIIASITCTFYLNNITLFTINVDYLNCLDEYFTCLYN